MPYRQAQHSSKQIATELFDTDVFNDEIAKANAPLPVFRKTLKAASNILTEYFQSGRAATELVFARSHFIDQLIVCAWKLYFDTHDKNIALVAVGGYGRGELHPGSDIDVLLLLRDEDSPYKNAIESFLLFLWDIGLEIGHSVRNIQECTEEATKDITVATNLQESRLLIGPENLYEALSAFNTPDKIWPGPEYFRAKLDEQIKRHLKFNDTAYNLEPNIKEGPGGLRDIQMIGWVAKRHFGVDTLHKLVTHGFLSEQEYKTLHEGLAFLWRVRFGLHIISKRREDRLLFDHQRTLAAQFGYKDTYKKLAVEQFMKDYYCTIMELSRLNEMLLQLFKEEILYVDNSSEPVAINSRFQVRKGFIEVTYDTVFEHYPFALLEIFLLLEQNPDIQGVRANTIRLIRDHSNLIDADFRDDLRCRSLFMEIMRQHNGVTHVLRRMNRYGVLAAYLPAFSNIVGQMQHDLFHIYTVDEHTLMVIRNLRRFTVPEFSAEFSLCSEIIHTVPKQELLLRAGLVHDIAKGRGGSHSELGAVDAELFCEQHSISSYDTHIVSWLIKNHLLMSSTAQRKDISDLEVVYEFATEVGDIHRLKYLYLLTVADIRATSDTVWNSWKDALLKDLYKSTYRTLQRGLDNPLLQSEHIEDTKAQSLKLLAHHDITHSDVENLWNELGDEYFLRYMPEEIIWHTLAILQCKEEDIPLVLIREANKRGGTELFIYSHNKKYLFANITTALEQQGVNIVDARIFASSSDYILDSFLFLDNNNEPIKEEQRLQQIYAHLRERLLSTDEKLTPVANHLARQAKHFKFPTHITFEDDTKNNRTIMNIQAYDRPGLLSRIGTVLASCKVQILNAQIATYGERAEDIFYISDFDGQAITSQSELEKIESAIKNLLED